MDEAICNHAAQADEIWHAGDIGTLDVYERLKSIRPVRAVYGNIDGTDIRSSCPLNQKFLCEDKMVWITHIGGYPPNYTPALRSILKENPPGIFICGHSHILKIMYDKNLGILHINPGAAGRHGFHHVRTIVRFVIEGKEVKDLAVIELGKRTESV